MELKALNISKEQLEFEGIHPDFGTVTLKELIATWSRYHDLGHIVQISRVIGQAIQKRSRSLGKIFKNPKYLK